MPVESFLIRGPHQLPGYDYFQQLAELDAREANPRSGIPDDQFEQLTLERALAEQLSPFNVGMALGARSITEGRAITPRESFIKSGSTVLQRDPLTGALKTVFSEKPKPGLTALQKAKLTDITNQLKAEYAAYAKADVTEKGEHARTIRGLREQMDAIGAEMEIPTAPVTAGFAAPASMDVMFPETSAQASALDEFGFGRPGSRTPFAFSGAAAAPAPVAPIRRRRYNPTTGRLE